MSVLVAGASLAGLSAAESLRKHGYDGEIVVVEGSSTLPSDRPPLSKQVLAGEWEPDRAAPRAASRLGEWGLQLELGATITSLGLDPLTVELDDGTVHNPEGLIIATGSRPRHLDDTTASIPGVHVLRDLEHSLALRSDLISGTGPVAVIGAGFIGAEVAATARKLDRDVTMIEAAAAPLIRVLPAELGGFIADLHRDNGVRVLLGAGVSQVLTDDDGAASGIAMSDGTIVDACVIVVGIGVIPNTEWADGSGLEIDNGFVCDEFCRAAPGVVVAGDVANWPNPTYGRRMRVEQWEHAIEQGEYVAQRLLVDLGYPVEDPGPFGTIPWFWSDQYDKKIQMAGLPDATDEMVVVEGSIEEGRFVVLFRRGDRCSAVLGVNRPRHVMQARMKLSESLEWHGVESIFG